ncbi:MAG TPA: NAD(+) diphosphatase [Micromonospora sp.]
MAFVEHPLPYSGGWLDRAGELRSDPDRLEALRSGPLRVVPLWRDRCAVAGDPPVPVRPPAHLTAELLAVADESVLLGVDGDGTAVWTVDLSGRTESEALQLSGADALTDVRALAGTLHPAEAATQAYARGILHWHRHQRYCGGCGARTVVRDGGHLRACSGADCGRLLFPRIEPAVIVLVETTDPPRRCLLARHRGATPGGFSLLAGFVEIGESLEDAVRREVAEEAGVLVEAVTYQASQAWPFPAGIMLGFRASARATTLRVDGEELVEARWFTRDELRAHAGAGHRLGRVDSIDSHLLTTWLAEPE